MWTRPNWRGRSFNDDTDYTNQNIPPQNCEDSFTRAAYFFWSVANKMFDNYVPTMAKPAFVAVKMLEAFRLEMNEIYFSASKPQGGTGSQQLTLPEIRDITSKTKTEDTSYSRALASLHTRSGRTQRYWIHPLATSRLDPEPSQNNRRSYLLAS